MTFIIIWLKHTFNLFSGSPGFLWTRRGMKNVPNNHWLCPLNKLVIYGSLPCGPHTIPFPFPARLSSKSCPQLHRDEKSNILSFKKIQRNTPNKKWNWVEVCEEIRCISTVGPVSFHRAVALNLLQDVILADNLFRWFWHCAAFECKLVMPYLRVHLYPVISDLVLWNHNNFPFKENNDAEAIADLSSWEWYLIVMNY